jgi:hypothetical protein
MRDEARIRFVQTFMERWCNVRCFQSKWFDISLPGHSMSWVVSCNGIFQLGISL